MIVSLAASAAEQSNSAWFEIAAQPLPTALKVFASQAGIQLLYEPSAVALARGNAVHGQLDKHAALGRLLHNTGLEVVYSSSGAATIRPTARHVQPQADASRVAAPSESARNRGGSAAPEEEQALEEVIVQARRREESGQSVPIAITVISQATLQENNFHTLHDLQHLVPSMSAITILTRDSANVSIRGQGSNGISGQPGVIAYINEVPLPTDKDGYLVSSPGLLFDLESVQVLKGPQGTLFGRNTTGGAVLLQTRRPSSAFGGSVQVSYGNYGDKEIDAAINVPLLDERLLMRVAVAGQERSGFTYLHGEPRHPEGIDADNREFWAVRATASFRPTQWLENDTTFTYTRYDTNGSPVVLTDLDPNGFVATLYPELASQFARQKALGVRRVIPIDTNLESRGSNLSLNSLSRIELTEQLTFRNILGYNDANTVLQLDLDGTSLPIVGLPATPRNQTVRQVSDEIQFLGTSMNQRLDWIVGAFFLRQDPPKKYVSQTGFLYGIPYDVEYRQGDESRALFAQGTYDLSSIVPRVKVTAGARYTWDKRFFNQRGGLFPSQCVEPRINCTETVRVRSDGRALTWTASLDYRLNSDLFLYLTSRRGYRVGGTNRFRLNGRVVNFDPEFVTDVEVGLKSDAKIGGIPVRANAAIYYQRYRDIQVTHLIPDGDTFSQITSNAAAARLRGVELETSVQLTDRLQVGAAFDYLDFDYAHLDRAVDAASLEASRTVNRPPRKCSVNARYGLPVPGEWGQMSVSLSWSWQDRSGDVSQPGGMIDAFSLLNVALDWGEIAGQPIDVGLFASNLTNELYTIGTQTLYDTLGFSAERYGEPRMYGVRLRYRFGEQRGR